MTRARATIDRARRTCLGSGSHSSWSEIALVTWIENFLYCSETWQKGYYFPPVAEAVARVRTFPRVSFRYFVSSPSAMDGAHVGVQE